MRLTRARTYVIILPTTYVTSDSKKLTLNAVLFLNQTLLTYIHSRLYIYLKKIILTATGGQLKNCDLYFTTEFQFQINCDQRFQENFRVQIYVVYSLLLLLRKRINLYDRKSLFQLLVPYDSSSVLSYSNKYFYPIWLKIRKSSLIKKNHILPILLFFSVILFKCNYLKGAIKLKEFVKMFADYS